MVMFDRVLCNVITNDNYKVDMEFVKDVVFLHCSVYNHRVSVCKEIIDLFKTIKDWLRFGGVEWVYAYTQNSKFVKTLWKDSCKVSEFTHDEEVYEVFECQL